MIRWPLFSQTLRAIYNLKVRQGEKFVVIDVPNLFETTILKHMCHPIIVVSVKDTSKQQERLLEGNKDLSEEEAQKMINDQPMPSLDKADIVVDNSGSKEALEKHVV